MHPLTRLILGLIVLLVMLAGVGLALPRNVTIARSVVINAPESFVFSHLDNLRSFNAWSPFAARDPQLQVSYAGPESGKGARVDWTSSKRSVGDGSMEITGSSPNRRIDLDVNFHGQKGKSFYNVVPAGSGSKVTWGFQYETDANPLTRWRGLTDRRFGAELGDGLTKLEELIESERRPMAPAAPAAEAPPAEAPAAESAMPEAPAEAPPAPPQP